MVDQEIFSRRLEALADYLQKVEAFKKTSRDEFTAEAAVHDLAERYLHLMMECVLDLANHTIASENLGAPDTYRDSFMTLSDAEKIDRDLAENLASWAGFRNVLVHEYLAIDHGLSWNAIQQDLGDIRTFYAWAAAQLQATDDRPSG